MEGLGAVSDGELVIGQNPSVSKSNRLHLLVLLYHFEVYSTYSSKTIGYFPEVSEVQLVHLGRH